MDVSQPGYSLNDLSDLPADLPVPLDDGAAAHLAGSRVPSIALPATDGSVVDLSAIPGTVVVFAYPRTGRPGVPSFVPEWDSIPGARGCTPHTSGFRDLYSEFGALGARVYGLSTQDTAYQREMVERVGVPFPVLSDEHRALTRAMNLPTMDVGGLTLLRRIAWIACDGVIARVFYPVFPPDRNAAEVLAALQA